MRRRGEKVSKDRNKNGKNNNNSQKDNDCFKYIILEYMDKKATSNSHKVQIKWDKNYDRDVLKDDKFFWTVNGEKYFKGDAKGIETIPNCFVYIDPELFKSKQSIIYDQFKGKEKLKENLDLKFTIIVEILLL